MVTPFFETSDVTIWQADARNAWRYIQENSVDAIVTSPPYFGLRDYGMDGQLGQEDTALEFVEVLADLLTSYGERVMKPAGSLWLNLGDTYTDRALALMPERTTLALSERGWKLRNRVVWHKTKAMPSPARDRLTARWEPMLHFVRSDDYFYDLDAIREPHAASSLARVEKPLRHRHKAGQGHAVQPVDMDRMGERFAHPKGANPGDVWSICPGGGLPGSEHIATFPAELVRRPILATVPEHGTVLDPFFGSGTTAVMARKLGRKAVGVELNPDYCKLAADRFRQDVLPFDEEVPA